MYISYKKKCLNRTLSKPELLICKMSYLRNKYPLLITGLRFAGMNIN